MKVVVAGGTGLIGSKIVDILHDRSDEVIAASPKGGVNTVTGEGLDEALAGASVVIDATNAPSSDGAAAMEFFETSSGNLLAAGATVGVRHHVALSIVGADRLPGSSHWARRVLAGSSSKRGYDVRRLGSRRAET